ncbi:MAG: restriction endonuclease subunit S [Oliverpabstia sp.]
MDKKEKWNYYKLDSVARLVSGRTPERERKEYYAPVGTPWVKIENLDQGYITEAAEYLSDEGREKVNLVPRDSVLFSIVGTIGKVGIAGKELATNQQIVALIFDPEKIYPLYGYYFLRLHAEKIRKLSNQTTMALISRKTLGQYRIYAPENLDIQRKIVEKLEKFQNYVDKKKNLCRYMETYEQKMFIKMFGQEAQYHEKLPLREFLTEDVGSGIPKNEDEDKEFPCIRSGEFSYSYLRDSVLEKWKAMDMTEDMPAEWLVREDDLLLRNGRLLLVDELEIPVAYERNVLRIRTRKEQLLPEVLYAYLGLPQMQPVLYGERKEGDMRKRPIRASELERMLVPYFTLEKQKQFAACLRKSRQIQRSLDRELEYAEKILITVSEILLSGRKLKNLETQTVNEEEKTKITETTKDVVCRLILAVLCGWSPQDERTGEYCRKRQEIFRLAQSYFQPVAFSFVSIHGQKEYLVERDFLAYYSSVFCEKDEQPLDLLRTILQKRETGELLDAHLAFQGEESICTEGDWNEETVRTMAARGLRLLAEYSGLGACGFLWDFGEE